MLSETFENFLETKTKPTMLPVRMCAMFRMQNAIGVHDDLLNHGEEAETDDMVTSQDRLAKTADDERSKKERKVER